MEPGNVDSHIQMPRFLLSRFENEYHKLFYYDVEKKFIGTNGHAKSMNTEHGYYPDEIEKFLSDKIEQPFSQFLQFIDSLDLDSPFFTMTSLAENTIKQFMVSLIIRGPLFVDGISNKSVFFQFLSTTDQHAISITQGIAEAQKQKIFDNYHVTFIVNKSPKPFILPICGLYYYKLNGYTHVSLPISPKIAVTLIESAGINSINNNGRINLYLINEDTYAVKLNGYAFRQQCKQQYGYVISPTKEALAELLPLCER